MICKNDLTRLQVRVIMVRIELALAATMERARKAADDT